MLREGADALTFELPAVEDDDVRQLSLGEYVGEQIVVLAFYPGDFNPACQDDSDLAALDLFAMQPDVAVVAVGPDTVYSHRAFAAEYDLAIPLCADTRREVAAAYEVVFEDEYGQRRPERAVFVVDLDGVIRYAWSTRDPFERPDDQAIQRTVADIGGDAAAVSRYRVGHAHYVEGRRAFTSAMSAFEDHDWMVARSDFERTREEFTTAADQFATSGRFVDAAQLDEHFERARMKATALWQAADWLAEAADAFSSGDGEEGQAYRQDAESPLETARDLAEPLDPDEITVTEGGVEIPDSAIGQADESVMDAIRGDDSVAGGVDLDVAETPADLGEEDAQQPDDGPDTDAARRLREYAGVGVDIDEPDGAEDDQIADALADADAPTGDETSGTDDTESATDARDTETLEDVPAVDEPAVGESVDRNDQPGSSADESRPADRANERSHDSTGTQPGTAEADISEAEIEEIAEELQAADGETETSDSGTDQPADGTSSPEDGP
ncbi:redoxin domain-containing protein [Halorhabdus sp. CUG00001]|uniref:redoxin domain-containing protein n=1 Tax=Halorhabdus sp. CUG00001 TaxID=2600297 RepID=UPI00131DDED1|nr:redoxin domain-containing protein [Halorhabdus sp. CUG00001]